MKLVKQALVIAVMSSGISTAALAQENRAEVIHWWTSGGESAALKVLAQSFEKAGGTWVDSAVAGGENARNQGINRIIGGTPPTMMQFNTGRQFDELVSNGLLRDLDEQAKAQDWAKVLPKPVLDAITRDGKVYAEPVNIHGVSWLFYSTKVFKEAGVEPPKTWDDVLAVSPKLKEKGFIPLALGGQPVWERSLFNTIFADEGGPDLVRKVYGENDAEAVRGPEFKKVADIFAAMRQYVDPGSPGRNWNDAVSLVITGKAGFTVNGDWAKGEFNNAGQQPDTDYGCVLPGPYAPLVIGGDVFVFPVTSDDKVLATQDKLIDVILDPEVQLAFNKIKGSVPVRQDVDVSSMDSCAKKAKEALNDPKRQLEAHDLLSTPDQVGAIQDVITRFWNNQNASPEDFIESFAGVVESGG